MVNKYNSPGNLLIVAQDSHNLNSEQRKMVNGGKWQVKERFFLVNALEKGEKGCKSRKLADTVYVNEL